MLRFSISSFSLQSLVSSSTMSSSRFNTRGRSPWPRGFCYRPPWDGRGGGDDYPFVSGDSHLNSVRDANYGYRQGYVGNYSIPRGSPEQDFRPRPPPQLGPHPLPQFRPHPQPQFCPHPWPQFRQRPPQQGPDDHRNWAYAVPQPPPQCERFRVLSYNILADYLARDHRAKLYYHIPHYILDWEWRKKRLLLEFGLWSPDIMCLQEVDRFHDLEEELAIRGYAGIWKTRTGKAVDGCAIFWRTNRFELRHEEHIEFNKLGLRDNVAQICVLESRNQNPTDNPSMSFPASSDQSRGVNQIVICNIHVLYNPKRGEMKLGQVRLLLDRAYAVSKIWNDAPVIVCGDFNSTPKSPLYKFISEQKLSLSGLARDQISGQHAASIYAPRPYLGSGLHRPQHSIDNHTEAKDAEQGNNFNGTGSHQEPQYDIENSSQKENLSSPDILNDMLSGKRVSDIHKLSNCVAKQTNEVGMRDGCSGDETSSLSKLVDQSLRKDEGCEEQSEILPKVRNFGNQDVPSADSNNEPCFGDNKLDHRGNNSIQTVHSIQNTLSGHQSKPNEVVSNESINHDLDSISEIELCKELKDPVHGESDSVTSVVPITHEGSTDLHSDPDSENNTYSAEMLPCTKENNTSEKADHNIFIYSNAEGSNKLSEKSISEAGSYREQLADHGGSGQGDVINWTCSSEENSDPTFFKELIGTEDTRDCTELYGENSFSVSPVHMSGNAETSEDVSDPTTSHNLKLDPPTARIQDDSSRPVLAANEEYSYNPYLLTPMEIEVASGNAGCSLVEHRLKLRSSYADVEDYAGTKDSSREPEVTSYNRLFMGTVDYIWYSEGLQTVKVLDTIPKHVLQRTPGFPTRKWGSDHLALACELAFTKGVAEPTN